MKPKTKPTKEKAYKPYKRRKTASELRLQKMEAEMNRDFRFAMQGA